MNCFIVNPNHISALVRWAYRVNAIVYYGNLRRFPGVAKNIHPRQILGASA